LLATCAFVNHQQTSVSHDWCVKLLGLTVGCSDVSEAN
jgi:hypothetical protein